MFSYILFHSDQMDFMNMRWLFSKNRHTLTVNSCSVFFFVLIWSLRVKTASVLVVNGCFLTNYCVSGAVVDSVCSLDRLQGDPSDWRTLEDSGQELNKDFFGSCLLAAVTVSSLLHEFTQQHLSCIWRNSICAVRMEKKHTDSSILEWSGFFSFTTFTRQL